MSKQELNIDLIKSTVIKSTPSATKSDIDTLIHLSKEYNLDPLKKEIYLIGYGNRHSVITSRDGYLKIANTDPNFDGIESDIVYMGDRLLKRPDGSLLIEYGELHLKFDKTQLSGAFCNIFRKDRSKPVSVFVSIKDYYKKGAPIWEQYTNAMILKVAESMALKRAFAISGLVTSEEVEEESPNADPKQKVVVPEIVEYIEVVAQYITKEQAELLEDELIQIPESKKRLLGKYRIETVDQLPKSEFKSVYTTIKEHKKKEGF